MIAFITFPSPLAQIEEGKASPNPVTLPLEFLVDSGAAVTMISGADVEKLRISYRKSSNGEEVPHLKDQPLEKGPKMGGVGGGIQTYVLPNVKLYLFSELEDRRELHEEDLEYLFIPEGKVKDIPNLLGRDLLSRFNIEWKSQEKSIELIRALEFGSYSVHILPKPEDR